MAEVDLSAEELADLERLIYTGQARLLRLSAQLSQAEAGVRVRCSAKSIFDWETDRVTPGIGYARRYYAFICELRDRLGEVEMARATSRS